MSSKVPFSRKALKPTFAISARIPFGLLLKVGGNNESMATLIVCPDAAAPSSVITNKFAVELGVVVGLRDTVICL